MPTRYLKPGICDSDRINNLSAEAEVFFYRLLVTVDDFGRTDARPLLLKAKCFPLKETMPASKIEQMLAELSSTGLLIVYQTDTGTYLQLNKWDNTPRAKDSKFPSFDDSCMQLYASAQHPPTVLPLTVTVTETVNTPATEQKTSRSKKTAANFDPLAWLLAQGVPEQAAKDWLTLRKSKKLPPTVTAFEQMAGEAARAGMTWEAMVVTCCARGWGGFKAQWLDNDDSRNGGQSPMRTNSPFAGAI